MWLPMLVAGVKVALVVVALQVVMALMLLGAVGLGGRAGGGMGRNVAALLSLGKAARQGARGGAGWGREARGARRRGKVGAMGAGVVVAADQEGAAAGKAGARGVQSQQHQGLRGWGSEWLLLLSSHDGWTMQQRCRKSCVQFCRLNCNTLGFRIYALACRAEHLVGRQTLVLWLAAFWHWWFWHWWFWPVCLVAVDLAVDL